MVVKQRRSDMKKLTIRQQAALKKHAARHTGKHMSHMKASMKKGDTFTMAHRKAMKKVGR